MPNRITLPILLAAALAMPHAAALAAGFPRVDQDFKIYDEHVAALTTTFNQAPANAAEKEWVKRKLAHMVEVDQYMRRCSSIPSDRGYPEAEKQEFHRQFALRWAAVDTGNTADLKVLLARYSWFTVSEFGVVADRNAWLLVQHADQDPAFQRSVLAILENLWPKNETSPANYAYLFDRVAASWNDPSARKLQRYGTQGTCLGPRKWIMLPTEDPERLDERRRQVGLGPQDEYQSQVSAFCY